MTVRHLENSVTYIKIHLLTYIHTINLPINLNTDLLLFGSTDLTNTLKTDIFLNVQKVHHK
jgi:hypothetical protein